MPTAPMPAARPQRIALDGVLPASRAVELTAGDRDPVVLSGEWAGVRAIVASEPLETLDHAERPEAVLARRTELVEGGDEVAVGGGWLGLIGYGAAARIADPALTQPPAADTLPAMALGYYDHVLVCDADDRWWLELLWTPDRRDELERRTQILRDRLERAAASAAAPLTADATGEWSAVPGPGAHARAVEACRERIACGDLYQANLALRLSAERHAPASALFAAGVAALAPQRAAYVAGEWGAVASFSPELLIARSGEEIRSEPIKGTRPRPAGDAALAERLHDELAESEKDRSENVMIVDLMRNDLGRVCLPGSVEAGPVCDVQPMAGVWHLVSTVTGRLNAGTGDEEVAAAVLPAGSVTGAPKPAAVAVIAELESAARQAFCGSAVLCSPVRGLELSVLIRTLEMTAGRVWLDVGGGITAASDPEGEAAECMAKAEPILRALGAELPAGSVPAPGPAPARLGPKPPPRPDPQAGVFTTILADGGRPANLAEHMTRLEASSRSLYGHLLPDRIGRRVRDAAAASLEPHRLRVTALPSGEVTVEAFTVDAADDPVTLTPVCLPGGLGAHKWADRRLVTAYEQHTAPGEPLFCDLDGTVLEASRWSIVADIGGELVTPPADGRILPSVGIAVMHEMLRPQPRALTLSDLAGARELYVVNAVRGMVPVAGITGVTD